MTLNLSRDRHFDAIPSFGIKHDEAKDLTYWQLKELKKQLPKASLMMTEFANDYGSALRDISVLPVFIQFAKEAGVLQMQMISEVLLLLAQDMAPQMAQQGAIKYLIQLRTLLLSETNPALPAAKVTALNLGQTLAKILIRVNTVLVAQELLFDAVPPLTELVTCSHQLPVYEGLLALVNVSAQDPLLRDKIVATGVWSELTSLISEHSKTENDAADSIRLAACELMANLSLTPALQQRAQQGCLHFEVQVLTKVLSFVRGNRPLTAILGFFANIPIVDPPAELATNVFLALVSSENEGVWHRGFSILAEVGQRIQLPRAEVES
jgi:hypothetical protein